MALYIILNHILSYIKNLHTFQQNFQKLIILTLYFLSLKAPSCFLGSNEV